MRNAQTSGFTLIEILVVLVITGFIVTILLQALHQVFRLQTHFGSEIFHTQNGAMYSDWFRDSINGLMPDEKSGKQQFRGEARRMSGLTLSPLDQDSGTLARFVWRLEFDRNQSLTSLYFGDAEAKQPQQVLAWRSNNGRFVYIDAQNEAHDSWPPFLGSWPQLPQAVYLETGAAEELRVIVATPKATGTPPLTRKEIEAL